MSLRLMRRLEHLHISYNLLLFKYQHSGRLKLTIEPFTGIYNAGKSADIDIHRIFLAVEVNLNALIFSDLGKRDNPLLLNIVGEVEVSALAGLQGLSHVDKALDL